jgi:pyridoxamine 5'-phosphate oxidase
VEKRISYEVGALDEASVARDPFAQFSRWFQEAVDAGVREPGAMTLATASADGKPSARIVLLRDHNARGFRFFTNYQSRKGLELEANPRAALVFYWDILERQLRIEGTVARLEPRESDAYFAGRPRAHQISAWASRQSQILSDRARIETEMARYEALFTGGVVERPPHWGGYRLRAEFFEFWQGRADRLHDRVAYTVEGGAWKIQRLSP